MRRITATLRLLMAVIAVAAMASCDRRPLEELDYQKANVRFDIDWQTYFRQQPAGMTILLYGEKTGYQPLGPTHSVLSYRSSLAEGRYFLVLFNDSFDEYGTMEFPYAQRTSHDDVYAHSLNRTSQTYVNGEWDRGVSYMMPPEHIGVALDTFEITHDMLTQQITLKPHTRSMPQLDSEEEGLYVFRETVHPMTSVLYIKVRIKGINNKATMEGSITGMADGFSMSQIRRNIGSSGTLLLPRDDWQPLEDSSLSDNEGWMTIAVPTFGLPHEKKDHRLPEDNVITLHFTLKDGSTRDFTYNVGEYIRYRKVEAALDIYAEVVLDLELVIEAPLTYPDLPDVVPTGESGGGFDVTVDEWEDGGTEEVMF